MSAHRPNIVHVVRRLDVGGLERGVINVATRLHNMGFHQSVLCLEEAGALARELPRGVRVLSCDRIRKRYAAERMELRAVRALTHFRPDVIHARNVGAWIDAVIATRLARLRPAIVFSIHGFESTKSASFSRRWLIRWLATQTSQLAAVSNVTAQEFCSEFGLTTSRFAVLRSGVDTARFVPHDRIAPFGTDIIFGYVGRLVPIKRLDCLVAAFATLPPDARTRLRFVGEGPMRQSLATKAEELGVAERVDFVGWRDDVVGELQRLDVFVLPSEREGRPTSVMEAMACGLPVIATRVGAIEELLEDQRHGLVVPPNDVNALSRALHSLFVSASLRRQFGCESRARAERNFSLDRMASDYAELYHDVASRSSNRRVARR